MGAVPKNQQQPRLRSARRGCDGGRHRRRRCLVLPTQSATVREGLTGRSFASHPYRTFEAARQVGVKKIIYASTNHVSGWREVLKEPQITPEQLVRPDSLYAVGKVFGEALGQFFVDRYDMSIICLRIGCFQTEPKPYNLNEHLLAAWCSPKDLAQLVRRSLDHDNLEFQIFYAISDNTRRYWDISNAQTLLGYNPQDNSENLLPSANFPAFQS